MKGIVWGWSRMWMGMWPDSAIYIPWWIWAITWIIAARWADRTLKRPGLSREWLYRLFAIAGFALLLGGVGDYKNGHLTFGPWPGFLGTRIWMPPPAIGWAMVAVAFAGFAFAWWARIHLGRLWSGSITRKEGHRVVDSGPYGLVRHPIYTGILLSSVATAVAIGSLHAYLGALVLIVGYWIKAGLEERFLREELGAADYDAYRRRVPMLVPFGPKAA